MSNVYSPYKAAHHVERVLALRKGELIYPTQIQIDLTNQCNHHCTYCFSKFTINNGFGKYSIETKDVLSLLDDAVVLGIPAFHYTGGGEPFEHKDIYPILEKTIKNGLDYGMVTNATLIDMKRSAILKKMAWIRISVDASTASMYQQLRGVDEFYKVIEIIQGFNEYYPKTELGVSFVVNPINYSQIFSFAELSKDLGVDNVRYSIAWFPQGKKHYSKMMKTINELISEAKKLEARDFRVFDLTRGRLENLDLTNKDYRTCGYQHFTTVIGADSQVYPCCTLKYVPEASFGSLKEDRFHHIWMGERRKNWVKRNHLKEVCSKTICWMEEKNKFIGYLIENNPEHVNFI